MTNGHQLTVVVAPMSPHVLLCVHLLVRLKPTHRTAETAKNVLRPIVFGHFGVQFVGLATERTDKTLEGEIQMVSLPDVGAEVYTIFQIAFG